MCEYCGALAHLHLDRAAEKEALTELHNIIVAQSDLEVKSKFLRHGFLPDAPDVLIESGMRCIPLIDTEGTADEVGSAAIQRLRAIMAKLRLLGDSHQTAAALREFETVLADFQEAERKLDRALLITGLIVLGLLLVGCYWLAGLWL
ncbi:MAG: hypothetical protein R6X32_22885 [Chloroflexota bacterium]